MPSLLTVKLRSVERALERHYNKSQDHRKIRNKKNVQAYRDRIKTDGEAWGKYKSQKNAAMREYRRKASVAQKQNNREKSKLRMKEYRQRLKAKQDKDTTDAKVTKRKTRQEQKLELDKQTYWREKQQQYRNNMSAQKKRRVREKDRERKRQKRHTEHVHVTHRKQENNTHGKEDEIASAVFQSLKGHKTQDKLTRKVVTVKLANKILHKYGSTSKVSKVFGIRRGYFAKCSALQGCTKNIEKRKKRSDTTSEIIHSSVQDMYLRDDASTQLPNKRDVSKKTMLAKRVLNRSIESVYKLWSEENPQFKLSFSKFASMRPKHCVTRNKRRREQCLCEYCENINLKIIELNNLAVKMECPEVKLQDLYHTSNITMCTKSVDQQYNNLKCLDRKCKECGVSRIEKRLDRLVEKCPTSLIVEWPKWEMVKEANTSFSRKTRVLKKGSLQELIDEFCEELLTFSHHLFVADWQKKQFSAISKSVPKDTVVLIMDFSQNFACSFQREVQSAHWSQVQVTLHPVVAFYSCPVCDDGVVREAVHIVSNDRCHDSHAVAHFTQVINHHLVDNRKLTIKRQIQFTDGCAGQYKSSRPFADVSYAMDDLNCNVDRNFFGSRHGKSESDGEGGVVKSAVSRSVTAEEAIVTDAESFFNFCKSRLTKGDDDETSNNCHHFKREFIFVKKGDINRNRRSREVKTVVGTRKIHCVRSVKGGVVKTRKLSCYCTGCINLCDCSHTDYVDNWKLTNLQQIHDANKPVTFQPDQTIELIQPQIVQPQSVQPQSVQPQTVQPQTVQPQTVQPQTGDFVAVAVAGKKRRSMYVARVLEVDAENKEAKVAYMYMHGRSDIDTYCLSNEDDSWHPWTDILGLVGQPTLSGTGSRLQFVFNKAKLLALQAKCAEP